MNKLKNEYRILILNQKYKTLNDKVFEAINIIENCLDDFKNGKEKDLSLRNIEDACAVLKAYSEEL